MSDGTKFIQGSFTFKDYASIDDIEEVMSILEDELFQPAFNVDELVYEIDVNDRNEDDFKRLKGLFKEHGNIIEWVEMNLSVSYSIDHFDNESDAEMCDDDACK